MNILCKLGLHFPFPFATLSPIELTERMKNLDVYVKQVVDTEWPTKNGNLLVDPVATAVLSHWWQEFKAGRPIG